MRGEERKEEKKQSQNKTLCFLLFMLLINVLCAYPAQTDSKMDFGDTVGNHISH